MIFWPPTDGLDFSLLSRPMPINFSGDTLQASITIEIADNAYYDPARSKSFRLQLVSSVEHVDVLLGVKDVTVTISDDEDGMCGVWLMLRCVSGSGCDIL